MWRKAQRRERGQMLIMFVGFVTVFLVMAAVVVDFGLWLAERREVQRVADLAAAAGAQDLPGNVSDAINAACANANANGYGGGAGDCGTSGSVVTVETICRNNLPSNSFATPLPGACQNGSAPGLDENCTSECDSLQVTITKPASVLFSGIFGIGDIRVSSGAAAGMRWQEVAVDGLVFLQTTSGMANPNGVCGAVPGPGTPTPTPGPDPSCPLSMQRYAAKEFVDFMFNQTGGRVQLGYSAYNYCYAPDWTPPPAHANECVISNHPGAGSPAGEVDLTTSSSALESAVDASIALGGTNVCLPLMEARRLFSVGQAQHGKDVKRAIVIVSDGDNNFQYGGALYPPTTPAPGCRPTAVAANGPCTGALPSAAERDMDTKAYQQAQALKQPTLDQQPVEIYVIGFRVCGSDNDNTQATAGYCSGIGDAAADAVADQRLLKCIASSPSDYFRVDDASRLAGTFTKIAERIIGQRLLQ